MDKNDTGKEVQGLLTKLRSAAEVIKKKIYEADQKIEALLNERAMISESRLSKEDFMQYVREDIQRRASEYPIRMSHLARNTGFPFSISFPQLERNEKSGNLQSFPYLDGQAFSNGAAWHVSAIYWLFGEQIEKRFSDALDQFDWPESSMSPDERRKRIAEIDQELEILNIERDCLASDLISTGMTQ
ncbi:hypothetical protein [Nitrosomonas sp.]|uniref:hypothetical protein n=1 Tax=Nitrosomonas sp. TaxID=42353 RepID=UPI0026217708|nr:hypothetical protein [Nitrosomonas sp.]